MSDAAETAQPVLRADDCLFAGLLPKVGVMTEVEANAFVDGLFPPGAA